jgi:antibiotic biosynthesis monooxygenase (ABM) superfamily enzyme
LIEEARPFLATEDSFYTRSGLDFLFVPDGEKKAHFPTKWKQFLVTWIGVYPLSLLSQMLFAPALHQAGFSDNIYLKTFILSGILVYLMVYVVMPKFTKLLQRWLYQ